MTRGQARIHTQDAGCTLAELGIRLDDSCEFTGHGRRLLVALGVVDPDPLRVEAEQWLKTHQGPRTPATEAVRAALGPDWPDEFYEAAERMRRTPWKGPIA